MANPLESLFERLREFTDRLQGEAGDLRRGGCLAGSLFIVLLGILMWYLLAERGGNILDNAARPDGNTNPSRRDQYCYNVYAGNTVQEKCVPLN